jgi:hypothetical protein
MLAAPKNFLKIGLPARTEVNFFSDRQLPFSFSPVWVSGDVGPPLRAYISDSLASKSWQSMGAIVRCRTESGFIFTVTRHVIRYSFPSSRNRYLRREKRLWLKLNRPPNNYWFSR